jgi:hypothetical protein
MKNSIINDQTLVGTKWLVKETKNGFCPFYITFNSGGVAAVVSVNGFFSGNWNYEGDFESVNFYGNYGTGEDYNCIGEPSQGEGHYTVTHSSGKQIGKFTMTQQS